MKQQKTGRLSLRGWFGRMLRQPPRGFYGQPSVYLSGGVMEIEHFRRVRTYEEGRLCLEFAGSIPATTPSVCPFLPHRRLDYG